MTQSDRTRAIAEQAQKIAWQLESGHTGDCDRWHNQGQHVTCTCDEEGRIERTTTILAAALADARREAKRELLNNIMADFDARCAAENHIIKPGLAFASGLLQLRATEARHAE